ncbi:MAG TPA: magnesium and cobalt transport protein CorA, partial [Leptospiraceae bacterium]|nr:magnesium and cobalt transport protein CorA [Leptospiraceae bacterium]
FLVLHTAQKNQDKVEYGETHVFIGYGYIVTVRHGASLPYTTVRERCEKTPEHLCRGPGFPLYAVMDFVVDNYLPIVEEFEDELVALEETIFKGNSHEDTTERIYDLKREIMGLRRATVPLLEVCNNLTRVTTPLLTAEVQPYFRDVHDHVVRINEAMETLREMLNTAFQVNLSLVTMKQNDVVKKLAGWAGLLGVPTMMASFYGMNFKYMPELEWKYGYPALMVVMISACLFLYYRLKKSDWL